MRGRVAGTLCRDIITRVGEEVQKPRLIRNTPAAVVAVFLTGLVAGLALRSVFVLPAHHSRWLFPALISTPRWAFASVQIAFYGYLLWLCFAFLRIAQGKERIVVVAWFLVTLGSPLETFMSRPAVRAFDYVNAFGMAAAFLTTIDILLGRLAIERAR